MNLCHAATGGRLFLSVAILLACGTLRAEPAELRRGPYVQMPSEEGATIVWRTKRRSDPVLRYGPSPDRLDSVLKGEEILTRVSADADAPAALPRLFSVPGRGDDDRHGRIGPAEDTWQFEARVTGLEPGVTRYYAIYDGERKLAGGDPDHFFRTHPTAGTVAPCRFWVVGDSGTGMKPQRDVHDRMREYVAADGRPLDLYLHVGDMAYGSGTDPEFQLNFFAVYQDTLRNVPCWPSMGNHEGKTSRGRFGVGPYYDAYAVPTRAESGGLASGTEAYYSFGFGRIHFVCLDSHDLDRRPSGAMAQWLRADLEETRADWLVAFWHHPPYTKGSHDSDDEHQLIEMREHIMPILEAGGVDLVLTGHSHIYERSMLMDGAYSTPTTAEGVILDDGDGSPDGDGPYRKSAGLNPHEGTVQIVAGHGGTMVRRRGTMPVMKRIIVENGSVIMDVDGDTMTGVMVNRKGERRDLFSIVKRGRVTPERVENPRLTKD